MSPALLAVFLAARALVESGGDAAAQGRDGETTAYQLTPAAVAWCRARGAESDVEMAAAWARQLERELLDRGVEPMPFNVALAWNAGVPAACTGRASIAAYESARRTVNLMESAR